MKRLLVKRLFVVALSAAASLTVAADARAGQSTAGGWTGGYLVLIGTSDLQGNFGTVVADRYFVVRTGSCASGHVGGNACFDLPQNAVYEVVNSDPGAVYLVVNRQRFLLHSNEAHAKFNQIFEASGFNLDNARKRLRTELPAIVAKRGTTSVDPLIANTNIRLTLNTNVTSRSSTLIPTQIVAMETAVKNTQKACDETVRLVLPGAVALLLEKRDGAGFQTLLSKYGAPANLEIEFGPGKLDAKHITFSVAADGPRVKVTIS